VAATPHKMVNGYELQFITNHLSHFYLFQLLKPLLIKSASPTFNSRVVSVSSLAHGLAPVQLGDYNFEKRGYDPMVGFDVKSETDCSTC
jgi:NAD(P)-dependent dehydrogenase (short-subunit alcohol dehydrogenase family)